MSVRPTGTVSALPLRMTSVGWTVVIHSRRRLVFAAEYLLSTFRPPLPRVTAERGCGEGELGLIDRSGYYGNRRAGFLTKTANREVWSHAEARRSRESRYIIYSDQETSKANVCWVTQFVDKRLLMLPYYSGVDAFLEQTTNYVYACYEWNVVGQSCLCYPLRDRGYISSPN